MKFIGRYGWIAVIAVALLAIAAWPAYVLRGADEARASSLPTAAPVTADYLSRDKTVAFWEKMVRKHLTEDMMSPRMLAAEYLQRYRERGDIDDVLRAEHQTFLSLRAQPRGNFPAELTLASVDLTLHRFYDALAVTADARRLDEGDPEMNTREATLDLEVGRYARANEQLNAVPLKARDDGWRVVESRYLELTGHLSEARNLLAIASAYQNANFDAQAQSRAWYYFRQGEMTYEAGDDDGAIALEKRSLAVFPNYADANRLLAKYECAEKAWQPCLDAATASANVIPYPETLGYEVDALRGLGRGDEAAQTDGLIKTEERIGNAQHISDRLLAIYYSDHREYPADALRIATRELAVRRDVITWDTLAWAAAMDGKWTEARSAERKAMVFDTPFSIMQYHAGVIAEHFGDTAQAKARFARALALNPRFDAVYADDARARLANL